MSFNVNEVDLSQFNIDELNTLIRRAQDTIKKKEQEQLVALRKQVEEMAASMGVSVTDLLGVKAGGRKKAATKVSPKYRNPANPDQTWSGRGLMPRWMREAVEQGAKKEDFLIK